MRLVLQALPITALALVSGCATTRPVNGQLPGAEGAIRAAEEMQATSVPRAALHLKFAQEQLEQAKALLRDGDNERAAFVLARARADAELALSLTREAQARAEAKSVAEQARALKQSL